MLLFAGCSWRAGCCRQATRQLLLLAVLWCTHPPCPARGCRCPGLHLSRDGSGGKMRVKATGGGAYKFAEVRGRHHCRPDMMTRGFALPTCPSPPQVPSLHCCLASLDLAHTMHPCACSCSRSGWA